LEKQLTISQIPLSQKTDYELLYNEAIALLQKYSGSIWTDYNEHDPGVTILEILCYVITELFDRTEIPINGILTKENGDTYYKENAFFTATEILHNAPLTLNDYRKLIIDNFENVNNAWVFPYYYNSENYENIGIQGLYEVLLDLEDKIVNELALKQEISIFLNSYRLFSEYFPKTKITVLKDIEFSISFILRIDESIDVEEILAEIFFEIENFINPKIRHYSYQNMIDLGFNSDQIFDGPKLKNGFINNQDLKEKTTRVYVDDFVKIISNVKGVKSVNNLSLFYISNEKTDDIKKTLYIKKTLNSEKPFIDISKENVLNLNIKESLSPGEELLHEFPANNPNNLNISVIQDNITMPYNGNNVISIYNKLVNHKRKTDKFSYAPSKLDIEIPKETYVNLSQYDSIQNDFPLIYGIGESKLSQNVSDTRKAQALQLKSYLLFFEQILADFNKQVSSIGNLFSVKKQTQTFFYQDVYQVPDASPLLKGFQGNASEIYDSKQGNKYYFNSVSFTSNKENQYIKGLEDICHLTDDFKTRRNMFLDHLLARFGFSLNDVAKSNSLNPSQIIEIKEELIQIVDELTAYRGRIKPENDNYELKNISVISLFHSLSNIKYNPLNIILLSEKLSLLYLSEYDEANDLFKFSDSGKVDLNVKSSMFHNCVFGGLDKNNYQVKISDNKYTLRLIVNGDKYNLIDGKLSDIDSGSIERKIGEFISDFFKIYIELENIYIIDHILLLPQIEEKKFTWISSSTTTDNSNPLAYSQLLDSTGKMSNTSEIGVVVKNNIIKQNFYSARMSIIIKIDSNKHNDFDTDYLHSIFVKNFPAHISLHLFFIKEELEFSEFKRIYSEYISMDILSKQDSKEQVFEGGGGIENITDFLINNPVFKDFKK
jgi:hypothetical protein